MGFLKAQADLAKAKRSQHNLLFNYMRFIAESIGYDNFDEFRVELAHAIGHTYCKTAILDLAGDITSYASRRRSFSAEEYEIEEYTEIIDRVEEFCVCHLDAPKIVTWRLIDMGDAPFKRKYIALVQNFKCAIDPKLSIQKGMDLHHTIKDTKMNNARYPNLLHSIFNLFGVNHDKHMNKGTWRPKPRVERWAEDAENALKKDRVLRKFANDPSEDMVQKGIDLDLLNKYRNAAWFVKIGRRRIWRRTAFFGSL